MFDIQKLIASVRENPALWVGARDTSKINIRDKIWNNIAEVIFPKCVEMTADEREEKVKEIKKKWKNLRTSYSSVLNHNRHYPSNKKCYYYADDLSFLDNHITIWKAPRDDDNEEKKEEEKEDVKMEIEEQKVQTFDQIVLDPDNGCNEDDPLQQIATPPPHESTERVTSSSMRQQPAIRQKVVRENQTQQPPNLRRRKVQVSSADRAFLLSILPDYRKLSYTQKLEFRMYALGFFKRANDQIAPSNGKH